MLQSAGADKNGKRRARLSVGQIRRRADVDGMAMKVFQAMLNTEGVTDEVERLECFGMGQSISIMVAELAYAGYVMVITHTKRYPTWDEIAEARYRLIPDSVDMVLPLPSDAKYVSLHPGAFMLWQRDIKRSRLIL